jgi:fructose-1,6-bisphosphatase I
LSTDHDGLESHLEAWAAGDATRQVVARAVLGLAAAGRALSALVAEGVHGAGHGDVVGSNLGGDAQKSLDRDSQAIVLDALRDTGIAALGSEEEDLPTFLDPAGPVVVAVDPLDGSSNIDNNVAIGTIFSILPVPPAGDPFLQPGSRQLAAGFIVYGPHTDLVLTLGEGTRIYTLDRASGIYRLALGTVEIPPESAEFAVNASNYRHWFEGTRQYFDDCIAGCDGPREKDFNMRWVASMVAEATRILVRGGVFLYPRDARRGYAQGRLRLVYEANPIAMVVEQAGGKASSGFQRILDIQPTDLHQRTPLIFGSANEVTRIEFYEENPASAERAPLFGYRGLFRE